MIEWKDPPPDRRASDSPDWEGIAAELRAHPFMWGIVRPNVNHSTGANTVRRIRDGVIAPFRPAGSFIARFAESDSSSERKGDVYARYVGNGDES